jgi:hypothetical protein
LVDLIPSIPSIPLEYLWNTFGIPLVDLIPSIPSIPLEYIWNTLGRFNVFILEYSCW